MRESEQPFAVGEWLVEPSLNRISSASSRLHLRPQVMGLLAYLAARAGKVATLESIHDDLWAGKVVSTGAIYNCIAELRQAFASDGSGIEYIETLPKRGYRLAPGLVTLSPAAAAGMLTVAVLPLVNRNGAGRHDYLCEGIADEVLHGLSRVGGLRVCSARPPRNGESDPRVVGMRHAAELVLSGSLQVQARRMRVMLRLEQVRDGHVVWSGRFDESLNDLLALQESVARQVIEALAPERPGEPAPRPTPSGMSSGAASSSGR